MARLPTVPRFGQFVGLTAVGFALLVGATTCPAFVDWRQEQQSSHQSSESQHSSQTQATPAQAAATQTNAQYSNTEKKTRKIWTEDDLIALRTPMDIYLLEKEAQEAAEAAAADEAAAQKASDQKAAEEDKPTISLPPTIEGTQDLIKSKQEQIDDEQNGLDRMTNELPNAPEDQKEAMQKEIDRVTADLPKIRLELKQLEDHLEALTKAQLNGAPPAENPAPPSNPQP
jgi:hypothetical protein